MDFVNLPLFAAAALVFTSVLAGLYSARIGFSFLLVFLVAGILAGEDGVGGWRFDDFRLSFWVGNLALAVILLDGGLRTAYSTFRTGLRPAAVLATFGVVICAGITALAGVGLLGLDWGPALLLGAIVGSTDAAAVFALLNRSGVTLNERVAATLEIESGVNDPMAVYLTLAFIGLVGASAAAAPAASGAALASTLALAFLQQFGWGALLGGASGFTMAALLRRLASQDAGGGILALLIGLAARALGLAMPDPQDERAMRTVFQDFALDPATAVGSVCAFYGLPPPADASRPLADWMADELRRPPVAGDLVALGPATLVVRQLKDGRISAIGLGLQE